LSKKIEDALNNDKDLFNDATFKFVKDFLIDNKEIRDDYLA
jgi:hypothetical protein